MNKLFNYLDFLTENVQAAKALLKKLGKGTDSPAYKQIIGWLGNATGYTHWFVKQHFLNGATLEEVEQIINTIKADKSIIDRFTTPVIQQENCEKFWDEYLAQSRNAEAKLAYNEFPAKQKKFLDLSNPEQVQMLKDLWADPDKRSFLSKLASYTDRATMIQKLQNHLYLKTSKVAEELLAALKQDDVRIVFADLKNEIIITTVTYPQIVKFCSDTAWCIVRSEWTFNHYIKMDYVALQFVIFLPGRTDNLRKIGVTYGATRMVTAHDMADDSIPANRIEEIIAEYGVSAKEIFSKEVRESADKAGLFFDDLPVQVLINLGFDKEEIVRNKTIYRRQYSINPTKTDLSFFTQEEVEKWNLLDKTELSESNRQSIHDYMQEIGYDVKSDDYFRFISEGRPWRQTAGFWIFAFKNKLVNSGILEEFLEAVANPKGDLRFSYREREEIAREMETKSAEQFRERHLFSEVARFTIRRGNTFNPEWLENNYPILKRNKDKIKDADFFITLLLALVKLDAQKELDELEIKITKISTLKNLVELVLGIDRFDKLDRFNTGEKKLVFRYLQNNLEIPQNEQAEKDSLMLPLRWLFDKKNLGSWFDKVKKVKNNEPYWGRSIEGGEKKRTNRLWALKYLLSYLAQEGKAKEISDVVAKFTFNKWEKKWLSTKTSRPGGQSWAFRWEYSEAVKSAISSIWKEPSEKGESRVIVEFRNFRW